MQIEFSSEGGFAGIQRTTTFDTQQLPATEATQLEALIEQTCFAPAPPAASPSPGMVDGRRYTIVADDGRRRDRLVIDEPITDDDLRTLVRTLETLARSQRSPQ